MVIGEGLEYLKHQHYLKAHLSDKHFPLDGSDWARLVGERLFREHHPHACTELNDFYAKVHSLNSPLEHERGSIRRGLHYWFLQSGTQQFNARFVTDETTQEKVWKTLARLSSSPLSLAEAEKKWVESRTKTWQSRREPAMSKDDKFWVNEPSDMWESRTIPLRLDGKPALKDYGEAVYEENVEVSKPLAAASEPST